MKQFRLCMIMMAALCIAAPSVPALADSHELPGGFADLVEKLSPAVVNISTQQKMKPSQNSMATPFQDLPDTPEFAPFRDFFNQFAQRQQDEESDREVYSLGSGFIIDPTGYVITNNHVIDDAQEVTVTLTDNTKYKAKVIGRDKKTDLALVKIESKKPLPFVPLGDSDVMRVGDWVIAIGNPFGLGGSVTQGIISARQRSINAGPFDDFLQTDAPINRGNSGGPLFNTHGEVIGINTAIFSPSGGSIGIGFAIPTALAKPVIEQLKEYGRTHRGWLGVKIQEVSEEIADSVGLDKEKGALVLEVSKGSPAEKAGLQPGDVITTFDGKDISEMRFLPRMVAETKIGSTVSITYWHKNGFKTAQVTIGELDESKDEENADSNDDGQKHKNNTEGSENVLGMSLMPLSPALREQLQLDDKQQGVAVVDLERNSEAAHRDVETGDVIESVNGETVKTVEELRKAFDAARKAGHKFALVKILNSKQETFITLPTEEEKKKPEKDSGKK